MIASRDDYREVDMTQVKSGKDILPELHQKTHFKGATTLLTDSREIKSFYNDAKLRSRFKTLEKSISKSKLSNQYSLSVDLTSKVSKGKFNLYDRDSSIQHDSRSNLMLNEQKTNRSLLPYSNNSKSQLKSKGHLKSILRLNKEFNSKSKDLNIDFTVGENTVSDYGHIKESSITSKNKNILVKYLNNSKISDRYKLKPNLKHSEPINSNLHAAEPDYEHSDASSILEAHHENPQNSDVNITYVTKEVLIQCGVVRKIK
jgi:hypothetical protein